MMHGQKKNIKVTASKSGLRLLDLVLEFLRALMNSNQTVILVLCTCTLYSTAWIRDSFFE